MQRGPGLGVSMPILVVTPPAAEPLTLADAKAHLRVDSSDEDAWISTQIQAVREWAEAYTERALITQTLRLYLDAFPRVIDLERPPVQSVEAIHYIDPAGEEQTLPADAYLADITRAATSPTPPRIYPVASWPETAARPNAVWVEYVAGYGDEPTDVPARIRSGMLLMLGDLYENRSTVIVGTVSSQIAMRAEDCLGPYVVRT